MTENITKKDEPKEREYKCHPFPQMKEFLKKANILDKFKYCERYMKINGIKIKEKFPINKQLVERSGANIYCCGIVFERIFENNMIFKTCTLLDGECLLNHESLHDKDGNIYSVDINMFHCFVGSAITNTINQDHVEYVAELLEELTELINNKRFEIDVIEYFPCNNCKKKSDKIKKCSRCLLAWYCDAECQKNDWVNHKFKCKISESGCK